MNSLSIPLAALYLRGAPRPVEVRRAGWPDVVRVIRRLGCSPDEAALALRDAGLWAEALVLETPGLMEWAERKVLEGAVLTCVEASYPWRWLRVLGSSAPPALWRVGEVPSLPSVAVVGSRQVPSSVRSFCTRTAREARRQGFAIVSGRAEGCDRAAAAGAGSDLVEIVPYGLDHLIGPVAGCLLTVCAPEEPFSTASAMERNSLIYASSSHAVIGHARFKEGGTWHGAVSACRGKLTTLVLRRSEDIAMRSLAALGGLWLDAPADLGEALRNRGPQGQLFGIA